MYSNDFYNSSIIMHLKENKHRIVYPKENLVMKQAMIRFHKCEDKKPKPQIKREMKLCKDYWGCYPLHYYRYNLYRNDRNIGEEELLNYIPEFFFYRLFLTYYDSMKFNILTEDKNITELIFNALKIKQPKTLLKIIKGGCYDENMRLIPFHEMEKKISVQNADKIFVKPADGEGGKGILVFHKITDGSYKTKEDNPLNANFLEKIKYKDYIIQEGISQNKLLSKIYPHSINTFRIATENKNGNVRIVCGVLRIGKDGIEVDNCSQGGIALGIDIETGRAKDYATTEQGVKFLEHPQTGHKFGSFIIPEWEAIKSYTLNNAQKLPNFTFLGWDIALTEEGPIAIEVNLGFAIDLYQAALGGLKNYFKIESPLKYWKLCSNKVEEEFVNDL